MICIHVIKDNGEGTRFQFEWKDKTPDNKILKELASNKIMFGYNGTIKKEDESTNLLLLIDFGDPKSGLVWDHPDTVVVVVDEDGNEIRRLKGPKQSRNEDTSKDSTNDPMASS